MGSFGFYTEHGPTRRVGYRPGRGSPRAGIGSCAQPGSRAGDQSCSFPWRWRALVSTGSCAQPGSRAGDQSCSFPWRWRALASTAGLCPMRVQ